MKRFISIIVTIAILLVFDFNYSYLYAEAASVKNYSFVNDINLNGINGLYEKTFSIEKYSKPIIGCYAEVYIRVSDIKKYLNSTATFYINDYPIKSIGLHNYKKQLIDEKIYIPENKISNGFNRFTIRTYHKIYDELCSKDNENPANWITFDKTSYIHIEYQNQKNMGIRTYPYPFNESNIIALNDNPTKEDIESAAVLSADMGRKFKDKDFTVSCLKYSQLKKSINSDIIYIGEYRFLPSSIRNNLTINEQKNISDSAIIKFAPSLLVKNKNILIITSKQPQKILEAIKALCDNKIIKQMDNRVQYISKYPSGYEKKNSYKNIKFSDLGYGDAEVKKTNNQELTYAINIPKDLKLKSGSNIQLNFRYSRLIDFSKSSIKVYFNDVAIKDKNLLLKNAAKDSFNFKIPNQFLDKKYIELKVEFYLNSKKTSCNASNDQGLWALVSKDSSFNLSYTIIYNRVLEQFPSPFVSENTFNNLAFVIPKAATQKEIEDVLNLSRYLGKSSLWVNNINLYYDTDMLPKDKNFIIIGTPKRNNLIRNLNNNLSLKFDNKFTRILPDKKIRLLYDYSKNLGITEIIKSKFNNQKTMMIVSGTTDSAVEWTTKFLTNDQYLSNVAGDVLVVDSEGTTQSSYYNFKKSSVNILEKAKKAVWNKVNINFSKAFWIFIVFFGVSSISIIFVILRLNKK